MGRITIFVSESCGYCLRAKKAFEERSVPFVAINISKFPERRKDMLNLSDQLTVPQIFFNEEHIGGASELFQLLDKLEGKASNSNRVASKVKKRRSISITKSQRGLQLSENGSELSSSLVSTIQSDDAVFKFYQTHIASVPDPTDDRLRPTGKTKRSSSSSSSNSSATTSDESDEHLNASSCAFGCFVLPNGQIESLRVLTGRLLQVMPKHKLAYYGKFYCDCFTGDEGCSALLKNFDGLSTRQDAVDFAIQLQQFGIIHHVCDDHIFQDSPSLFFRLQPYHEPHVLNSFKKSIHCKVCNTSATSPKKGDNKEKVNEDAAMDKDFDRLPLSTDVGFDAIRLICKLRKLFKGIRERAITSEGMDYVAASNDPRFEIFEDMASELQCVDILTQLRNDDNSKLVFFINLYNLMIQHAFTKVGIPKDSSQRSSFFGGVCYNVGGHTLSLDDIEHGIIRGNTRHPYQFRLPFPNKSDVRRQLSVSRLDPRIHFALNCGANSCPPISTYTVEALDEELRIATMSFFEHDSNVIIDLESMDLSLSMILKWYRSDFCSSGTIDLPQVVAGYLRDGGKKKRQLQQMLDSGKSIKIKYLPYDWNTDACNSLTFRSSVLTTTQTSFLKAFMAQSVFTYTRRPLEPPPGPPTSALQSHPLYAFRRSGDKNEDQSQRANGKGKSEIVDNRRMRRMMMSFLDIVEANGVWLTVVALLINATYSISTGGHSAMLLVNLFGIFAVLYYREGKEIQSNEIVAIEKTPKS